jgi:hypothetical protein
VPGARSDVREVLDMGIQRLAIVSGRFPIKSAPRLFKLMFWVSLVDAIARSATTLEAAVLSEHDHCLFRFGHRFASDTQKGRS